MGLHLFILLLFTGVVPVVPEVYRKYYLFQEGKTMSDARAYCRVNYTDLATIENQYENVQIQNLAKSQNCVSSLWIGLYNDVNSWRWSMGNQSLGTFTMWFPPNPDNYQAKEYCSAINSTGWIDHDCALPLPFICFDGRNTSNSNYIYIPNLSTWHDAQSYCRQYHTDLASARNASENSLLLSMTSIYEYTWFGLFRDSWKWSDQTPFTSIPWVPGEPNNLLGQENCVYYINGQVGDVKCSRVKFFICESVITGQKQMVTLKVQSSQDVNDPAVKLAILDKVKQKLNALGNINAEFIKQPNGLVFKKMKENNVTAGDLC